MKEKKQRIAFQARDENLNELKEAWKLLGYRNGGEWYGAMRRETILLANKKKEENKAST